MKEARETSEKLKIKIHSSKANLENLRGQLADLQKNILVKTKELKKLRDDVSDIKGKDIQEISIFTSIEAEIVVGLPS